MRIYTRSGDDGTTALVYGKRVSKADLRVEAYGICDEANAMIGLAVSYLAEVEWKEKKQWTQNLQQIQTILFHVGAVLSTPKDKEVYWQVESVHIDTLEKEIDKYMEKLPPLKQFILPGGHKIASTLHLARTIVRRAERAAVKVKDELGDALALTYLNRLSDYLFVAARYVNYMLEHDEIILHADV